MKGRGILILAFMFVALPFAFAATEEQQLATLAAAMLNLTGNNDYVMDCGPVTEVLYAKTLVTQPQGKYYCVLNMSGKIAFGTFVSDTTSNARQAMLQVYNDTMFSSQVRANDLDRTACDGKGVIYFEECPNAIRGSYPLRVYVYDDGFTSDAIYIIVSEQPLQGFIGSTTFLDSLADFFRNLFGVFG